MAAGSPSRSGLFRTHSDIHFLTSSAKANYVGLFKDYTTKTTPSSTTEEDRKPKGKKSSSSSMANHNNKSWMSAMRDAIAVNNVEAVRQIAQDSEVQHVLRQTQFWRDSYSPVNHATSRARGEIIKLLVQEFGAKVSSYGEYINGSSVVCLSVSSVSILHVFSAPSQLQSFKIRLATFLNYI